MDNRPVTSDYRTAATRPFTDRDRFVLNAVERIEDYFGGDLADILDVQLMAQAHVTAGPDQRVYVALLDQLEDRREDSRRRSRMLEADARRILSKPVPSNESDADVPVSLLSKDRHAGTSREWCPRAQAKMVRRGDTVVAVWPECRSRTCSVCRPRLDDRDTMRVLSTFSGSRIWLSEIPVDDWGTTAKRLRRHGSVGVKMASSRHHDHVVVLASEPVTPNAIAVSDATVRDVVSNRPPGSTPQKGHQPRPRLTGIGLPSIKEWEQRIATDDVDEAIEMDQTITPDALADAADGLGIDYTRQGRLIELHAEWDSPAMTTLRAWAIDPMGGWKVWLRQQQGLEEQMPLELYEPPAEDAA